MPDRPVSTSGICETCHDAGTIEEPINQDHFGNWDTRTWNCPDCGTGKPADPTPVPGPFDAFLARVVADVVDGPTPDAPTLIDGQKPGCVCGPECEWPCWQRVGIGDDPCCPGCTL